MAKQATLATLSSFLGGGYTPVAPRHRQVTGEGLLHVTWRQETKNVNTKFLTLENNV